MSQEVTVGVDSMFPCCPGEQMCDVQVEQGHYLHSPRTGSVHLQGRYFQMSPHCQAPGDTAFGKVTIPLSSMVLDHIPIWRPGPMERVTQLVKDGLMSGSLIPPAKTLFPNESPLSGPR
jgi:hypothetical protein